MSKARDRANGIAVSADNASALVSDTGGFGVWTPVANTGANVYWVKLCKITGGQASRYKISLSGGNGYSAANNFTAAGVDMFVTVGNNSSSPNLNINTYIWQTDKGTLPVLDVTTVQNDIYDTDIWVKADTFTSYRATITGNTSYTTYSEVYQSTEPTTNATNRVVETVLTTGTHAVHQSSEYTLLANNTIYIPDEDIPREATLFFTMSGDIPGGGIVHVYRRGTYNKTHGTTAASYWNFGGSGNPGSGTFRMWIDGNAAGASLAVQSNAGYGRNIAFMWVPPGRFN